MSKSTPIEIRRCIVSAYEFGNGSYEQIAELFGVGRATVNRILRRHRETGDVIALPRGGHNPARIQPKDTERLAQIVADMPGATLDEFTEEWRKRVSTRISRSSMLRGLNNHGITFKKKAIVLPSSYSPMSSSGEKSLL